MIENSTTQGEVHHVELNLKDVNQIFNTLHWAGGRRSAPQPMPLLKELGRASGVGVTINMALLTEMGTSPSLKIRIRCSPKLVVKRNWNSTEWRWCSSARSAIRASGFVTRTQGKAALMQQSVHDFGLQIDIAKRSSCSNPK